MEFKLSISLKASATKVYKTWLNSKGHTDMTGSKADINDQLGSKFTAWDGYIHGENLELETNKRIVQTWRTSEFKTNQEDSLLEIEFIEIDKNSCKIILQHSNLEDKDSNYIKGWKDHYFEPMKKYFAGK
ncbi:MAG: SRPBCC domain-containing protein [Saprospiraceae bacterium]